MHRRNIMSKYGTDETSKKTNPYSEQLNTDDITAKIIGDFGRWQFWISFLMTLLKLPIAWYQLNIIFLAPPQDFWCAKPDSFASYSDEEWRKICAPVRTALYKDLQIVRVNERTFKGPKIDYRTEFLEQDLIEMKQKWFYVLQLAMDRSLLPLVACPKFVYNKTTFNRSITSDWDLVCSKHWLTHLTQCIMMWGIVLGGIIFGVLADKYGRRIPLMIGILIQGLASFVASFMPHYWWFIAVWFILALGSGGVGIISFVICMEVVSGKYRTTVPVLYQLPFGLGNAVMAGFAYWLRDWRKLEFTLAALSSLFILYWFWIPESPRWLLATGQTEKAMIVLKKAAQQNGKCYTMRQLKQLMPRVPHQKRRDPGFSAFFRSKNMRLKTFLLSINWFFTGLAFYTFSQYLGSIGGNIFVAVAWTGIISTLGAITCVFIVTKMGRKTTVGIYQLITAVCFVMLLVVPKDLYANDWPRLLFAGIGFAGMAGSIPALYLFSGELFPTLGRNVGISGVTTFARIASMIAPAVVSLDSVVADLPLILLAVISFAQVLLLLPLPETKDKPMPDTMEQAELF